MHTFQKTRLAPTPSGYLHAGNFFSFALTAGYARDAGAALLLRIDDMDQIRARSSYLHYIFDALKHLNIAYDEGPANPDDFEKHWSQHQRMPLYDDLLNQLKETGKVFACTCSRKDIEALSPDGSYPGTCRDKDIPLNTKDAAWRIRTEPCEITLKNWNGIETHLFPIGMGDFVIRKKDGLPAYQLSSLADDLHFGIDLIVRGMDLLHSTLAQAYLARLLSAEAFLQACFIHHPLILTGTGEKLSKSAGTHTHPSINLDKSAAELWAQIGWETLGKSGIYSWWELYQALP